jgi:hypothetical protein
MSYELVILFSASIIIAGVIGLIRFKKIDTAYHPFIYCTWIGCINEVISYILTNQRIDTSVNNNIYQLVEILIINWQFRRWGVFDKMPKLYFLLQFFFTAVWVFDILIIHNISGVSMYLWVVFSFAIVILSINYNNMLIISYRKSLLKNAAFLICSGYIIFFTFNILIEAFLWYALDKSKPFRVSIFYAFTYINLFVNLIFTVAILWIPRKKAFIPLYS